MSRIRNSNTKPEVAVRSLLHRLGYRFRKNLRTMPGKPDIVLKKHAAVIFVHGCFWHMHKGCKRSNMPKSRIEYWQPKLAGNVRRFKAQQKALKLVGWRVLTVWECEIRNQIKLEKKLIKFLSCTLN